MASDAPAPPLGDNDALVLRLEGFEGPLDLLLELARAQKLDLASISILALVEQYLAVIEGARKVRLELAADWLVMAAWLTWLKSRLLVPKGHEAAEEGEAAAEVLADRLRDLPAMRAGRGLAWRPPATGPRRVRPRRAGGSGRDRPVAPGAGPVRPDARLSRRDAPRLGSKRSYRPAPLSVWTVQDALSRLALLVGNLPDWASLEQFLPERVGSPLERRAALASTLLAGLEMARGGAVRLRQEEAFGPILVRRGDVPADGAVEEARNV